MYLHIHSHQNNTIKWFQSLIPRALSYKMSIFSYLELCLQRFTTSRQWKWPGFVKFKYKWLFEFQYLLGHIFILTTGYIVLIREATQQCKIKRQYLLTSFHFGFTEQNCDLNPRVVYPFSAGTVYRCQNLKDGPRPKRIVQIIMVADP